MLDPKVGFCQAHGLGGDERLFVVRYRLSLVGALLSAGSVVRCWAVVGAPVNVQCFPSDQGTSSYTGKKLASRKAVYSREQPSEC